MIAEELISPQELEGLMAMIPPVGTLVQWDGEEDAILLRDSAKHLADASGPHVQLRQCLDARKRQGFNSQPLVFLEVESVTHEDNLLHRPVMAYIRRLIKDGKVKRVWCQMTSRMSRSSTDTVILKREAEKYGAKYHYAQQEGLSKLDGLMEEMVLYIMSVMDQLEAANSRMKMYEGRKAKWSLNRLMGCERAPYGHRYVDADGAKLSKNAYLEPDPEKAPIVVGWYRHFMEHGENGSTHRLASEMNRLGILPPWHGKKLHGKVCRNEWSPQTIRRILLDPVNIGEPVRHKGRSEKKAVTDPKTGKDALKKVRYDVPEGERIRLVGASQMLPGLTKEMYYRTVETLKREDRKPPRKNNAIDFELDGRIVCGECGMRFHGINDSYSRKDGTATVYHNYEHGGKGRRKGQNTEKCPHGRTSIKAGELDFLVWSQVWWLIDHPEELDALLRNRDKIDMAPILEEIEMIRGMIEEKVEAINSMTDLIPFQRGDARARMQHNLDAAQDQKEELEQRLHRLQGRKASMVNAEDRVAGIKDQLRRLRDLFIGLQQHIDDGTFSREEVHRLKTLAYDALDIEVRVWDYPSEYKWRKVRDIPARYITSSILGRMPAVTSEEFVVMGIPTGGRSYNSEFELVILWRGAYSEPILLI
jgi:DNA invertase Pin-like site-specific DNA recombinase